MPVDIDMFDEGDEMQLSLGRGVNRRETSLEVVRVDDEPERGDMRHEPTRVLECETLPRRTKCRVEKLEDGRVRFRYEGSNSPMAVHAVWGKRDPDWDGVEA